VNEEFETEAFTSGAIASPERQLGGGHRGVTDQRDVRASITESGDGVGMAEHLPQHVHAGMQIRGAERREPSTVVGDVEVVERVQHVDTCCGRLLSQ